MRITFDPYIPLALWVPLALAAAGLLAWYAAAGRRRLPARSWWPIVALMAAAAAVPLVVSLRQRGSLGLKTTLALLQGDEPVEKRRVALKPDDAVEEVFYVSREKSGLYRYEVRAEALPKEATGLNNSAPLLLRVIDQPVRVLLLEGKPYWDTKFLVRTLSNDASVELTGVVGDSDQSPPVITYHPVGAGRVVVVEGAGMWRWAFLPPDRQKQEEIYGTLWQSLLRWLATHVGFLPSQRMALRTDALTFNTDENVMATLLVREWSGKPPRVELTGQSLDKPRTFTAVPHGSYPGQYHIGMGRLAEGRYLLRVLGVDEDDLSGQMTFDVRGRLTERLDVRAQPGVMQLIARQSGGRVMENMEPDRLAREFQEHLVRARPPRTARTMAWDRWWVLSGALLLWGAAWGLRRRSGLV